MPFVERGGYRLHHEALGRPDAPPLLLVMGLGMCSRAWHTLPERLAARFRVLVFDNRGVGQSSAARGGFRIRDLADDAARVLDAEGVPRASVFGISMGGMIAQELALGHPERVRALALGATFGGHWRSHKPSVGVALDLAVVALLARSEPRMARLLVSDAFYAANAGRFAAWLGSVGRARREVARRQILAIARHEAEGRLAALRVPTLVLTGDQDRLVPPANSRRLARVIPGARLAVLPGAGHAFPFEQPDETVRLLTEHFLAAAP